MPEEKNGPCTKCEYFHVCTGGCPQHTIAVTKTGDLPSPWCGVFGNLLPKYIEARARHMLRQLRSTNAKSTATSLPSECGRA
jgi:sulfatase maturation enzyme AslB (radical SAM superfamily)